MHRVGGAHQHSLFQSLDHLRRVLQRLPERRQHVIHEHYHGLAFDHSLPRGADLVILNILRCDFLLFVQVGVGRLHVFVEIERLVLQGMSQFVRQHRLLLLGPQPVQQVYGLGLRVVVAGHLLLQQGHQKLSQVEVTRQQSEFFSTSSERRRRLASSSSEVCSVT